MLLASVSCFSQTGDMQKWTTLSKKSYTILLPPGWIVDSSKQMGTDCILFSALENASDKFMENVNIMIQPVQGMNMDLDKYTAMSEKQIRGMAADANILESKRLTSGNSFQKMIYTATQNGFKLKFEQYYCIFNDKAFIITLTTEQDKFELYKTTGEQILNSFRLRPRA